MSDPGSVWITGASSGIGRELALLYARDGWTIYASARNTGSLQQLADDAKGFAGSIVPAPMDVTHSEDIQDFINARASSDSLPSLAIFNAGYYEPLGMEDMTFEHVRATFDVNFLGAARGICELLPHYQQAGSGHIAVVSSVAGYTGLPRATAYGSSKAALIHFCESLKPECDAAGVTISMVNPGFVRTPLTDKNEFKMPFIIEPEHAAQRIKTGLDKKRFDINFPKRFSLLLKVFRLLPYPLYFAITKKL